MKKLFTLLAGTLMALSSQATHLMGGDLVLTHDSSGYRLHHTNYRDTVGIPAYQTATLNIYKWDALSSTWSSIVSSYGMPIDSPSSFILLTGIPYGVQVYNYYSETGMMDSVLSLNGSGAYRCVVYDCCRNNIIGNMTSPGGESLVLSCEFNYDSTGVVVDNTPEFLAIPVIYGPINNAWAYNPLPYDADGDSLSWEINTPIGGIGTGGILDTCAGYLLPPSSATGAITLNAVTGEFTWTPNMLGNFVASFKIHEYRGGVEIGTIVRDMQYVVIPDSAAGTSLKMPEFVQGTPYLINTSGHYNFIYYNPGVPFSFDVLAEDANTTDVLTMEANSELLKPGVSNASFSFIQTGLGNQVLGTFKWTPSLTDSRDKILAIRAKDGTFIKDFTILLRKFTAPAGIGNITTNEHTVTIYPNPNTSSTLTLSVQSNIDDQHAVLSVYDMTGRKVKSISDLHVSMGQTLIRRDLDLPRGLYTIQLHSGNTILGSVKYTRL